MHAAQFGSPVSGHGVAALSPWLPAFAVALATFATSLAMLVLVTIDALAPARARSLAVDTGEAGGSSSIAVEAAQPSLAPPRFAERTPGSVELATDPRLQAAVEAALGSEVSHYGVVVRRLKDGRGVAINAAQQFYAASTFKLAVLYQVELLHDQGLVHDSDTIVLSKADAAEDLGTIRDVPTGPDGSITIADALHAMITISDNATAVALLHLVGASNVDTTLSRLGLQHTSVNTTDLPTDAADMALLMEAIVDGNGVSDRARQEMRDLLAAQETRTGIPAGLPANVPVGNKTGTWKGATHDVAFVDAPGGMYVIAVLSDGDWSWAPIARVSKAVYETLASE